MKVACQDAVLRASRHKRPAPAMVRSSFSVYEVGKPNLPKLWRAIDSEDQMIRRHVEYMEKHSSPGSLALLPAISVMKRGQLTEAVRRKPYSVILLDEIEKAHPEVFNILLQMLDDGRVTDSKGKTVDFKNTVVIMTSNIGSDILLEGYKGGDEIAEDVREKVLARLKSHFRPEFLNRVDETIMFKPLTMEEVGKIVTKLIADLEERLKEKQIKLLISDEAKQYLAENGFDPVYGALTLYSAELGDFARRNHCRYDRGKQHRANRFDRRENCFEKTEFVLVTTGKEAVRRSRVSSQ